MGSHSVARLVTVVIMKVLLVASALVRPRNELTCNICLDIMRDLDDFITSDTTEQEIVDAIKGICKALGSLIPNFEDTCNFIIQSQLPAIIDAFVHDNMDPTQVCTDVFAACPLDLKQDNRMTTVYL